MFTLSKNFIKVGEDLFLVLRTFKEESILNVDLVKEWLSADVIYKREGVYYFCEKIQDLEIL
jgi:hypothetical protein